MSSLSSSSGGESPVSDGAGDPAPPSRTASRTASTSPTAARAMKALRRNTDTRLAASAVESVHASACTDSMPKYSRASTKKAQKTAIGMAPKTTMRLARRLRCEGGSAEAGASGVSGGNGELQPQAAPAALAADALAHRGVRARLLGARRPTGERRLAPPG